MQYLKLTFILMLAGSIACNAQNKTNMFFSTAAHVPIQKSLANDCFRKIDWKFSADASVRSTPVAVKI